MKESYWGYWLILLGVFIFIILMLIQSYTTANTQDYYIVKEITEQAMVDAIDYTYYREYGEVRINKEVFYESFLKRFVENTSLSTTYTVSFYDVYEAPPKVSVKVTSKSNTFTIVGNDETFESVNKITSILESYVKKNSTSEGE